MANKIFDRLGMSRPRYSAFDLSREQKLTFKMGDLIPTYLEEIVPGDQFRVKTESLIRFAPMVAPIMHRVNVYLHYFFVPNRILWREWEDFITGGPDGQEAPTYPIINFQGTGVGNTPPGSLHDYLGIPIRTGNPWAWDISQLPYRAYQSIWNDYYRDQNLFMGGDPRDYDVVMAPDGPATVLRQRSWEKDYFTSSLPGAQRGASIGVNADIEYKDQSTVHRVAGTAPADGPVYTTDHNPGKLIDNENAEIRIENLSDIDINIQELRKSAALQRWLEKSMRGGARYIETILSHFGVRSDDARLQRPEYLGGGKQPVVISEVLNTTGTEDLPQGNMAGHGISAGTTNSFQKSFKEHGYVLGIMSVIPNSSYYQGIDRHWKRRSRFDYYWPEFANLGEQEVKNEELFANQGTAERAATFGYQQRYAEYKYGKSSVHGLFKEDLEYWHLGRKFATAPALTNTFVRVMPEDQSRIFAAEEEEQILAQLYHNVKARRPMPYFADPRLT